MHSSSPSDWRPLVYRLLRYIQPYRAKLVIGLLCGALSTFILPAAVWQLTHFPEATSQQAPLAERIAGVVPICLMIIGLYTTLLVLRYVQSLFLSEVTQRLGMSIRREVFAHLQKMPLAFFHQQRTGALMATLTNDVTRLQNSANVLKEGIALPVQAIVYVVVLFVISWRLTLFAMLAVPLMGFVIGQVTKKLRQITSEAQAKLADVSNVMEETLSAPRVVKAFSAEEREVERFDQENEAALQISLRGVRRTALLSPTVDWIGALAISVVLYVGTVEQVSPPAFLRFVAMANLLANSIGGIGNLRGQFEEMRGAAERIFEQVLDTTPAIRDAENATTLSDVQGEIVFESVSFGYSAETTVLSEINLTIQPGEVVAFVGPTGAGKSTLADLIPRFYDPLQGRVLIDGHDLRTVTMKSLRQQIGIVPQDTLLFSGTIRSNIAYGKPDATDSEIEAAARAANAHEFILAQPQGYKTLVGERGTTLSGGQKQRLAIARALLSNPRILIFDEATSALDTQTESVVQEALSTWFKGRTTLIIAHRLSTIANANKIVVLQQGRIVEVGCHSELLAQGGLYAALYNAQQKGIEA